ncbi:hypothetical protein ACFX2V_10445 [Gilliamella apicola]
MESISNFFVWRMAVLVLIYRVSFIKTWLGLDWSDSYLCHIDHG